MRRAPRRSTSAAHLVAFVALALVAAACGTNEPAATSAPVSNDMLVAGEELYAASCAECHGSDLRGTDRGPSHLSIVYEPGHHSDAAFLLAVRNGVRSHHWNFGPMLPIDGITDEEIAAITAYVRSVQAEEGFEPYP